MRSHTFYPLCLLGDKKEKSEGGTTKKRWKEEQRRRWRRRGGLSDHCNTERERAREQSFGKGPASATIQLLCRELTWKGPFREGEKRIGDDRKIQKLAMRGRQSEGRRGQTGKTNDHKREL